MSSVTIGGTKQCGRQIQATNLRLSEASFFVILTRNMVAMVQGTRANLLNLVDFLVFTKIQEILGMSLASLFFAYLGWRGGGEAVRIFPRL